MKTVKITTTVPEEYLNKLAMLRQEGITVSDLISIALKLYETNKDTFYAMAYFVRREKETRRMRKQS